MAGKKCQVVQLQLEVNTEEEWEKLLLKDGLIGKNCKSKGKAVPLRAWSGPEGSRKLRFPDFMTTAQVGGKVVSLTHRPQVSTVTIF